jgi:hypothetical protein
MWQTILHSITDIMAAAADVMDMEKDRDRAERPINRLRPVRLPRFRESSAPARLKRLLTKISPSLFPGSTAKRNTA